MMHAYPLLLTLEYSACNGRTDGLTVRPADWVLFTQDGPPTTTFLFAFSSFSSFSFSLTLYRPFECLFCSLSFLVMTLMTNATSLYLGQGQKLLGDGKERVIV
jgi:hypothetical protein